MKKYEAIDESENLKPTRFIRRIKVGRQDIKQGNNHEIKSITKEVITDEEGRVLLYLPDFLHEEQKNGLMDILNRNNRIII